MDGFFDISIEGRSGQAKYAGMAFARDLDGRRLKCLRCGHNLFSVLDVEFEGEQRSKYYECASCACLHAGDVVARTA